MIKSYKSALRRHHRQRLNDKRKNYHSSADGHYKPALNSPKVCSCFMCGNPRKYFNEMSLQERKALLIGSQL